MQSLHFTGNVSIQTWQALLNVKNDVASICYSKFKFSDESISTRSIGKLEIKDAVLIWWIVPGKGKSILLLAQTYA